VENKPVKEVLETAAQRLAKAGCDTPALDAELLLAHIFAKDRTWLVMHPRQTLDKNRLDNFFDLLRRRERREPVAYITGQKEFFALEFQVNRHVLIPRPETELLVETAIQIATERVGESTSRQPGKLFNNEPIHNTQHGVSPSHLSPPLSPVTIADVGTGSGCIVVSLAKNLAHALLFAVDASAEALSLARHNAARHQVAGRITFLAGNLLHPLPQPVDLIVSNPPYISRSDLAAAVPPEVGQYEPRLALDGGEDGLEVIRQLLFGAGAKLNPGGTLLAEIGAAQGRAVTRLAKEQFPEAGIRLKKDLAGLDRLLMVQT
jgi:release factor glutamine methyltransferase